MSCSQLCVCVVLYKKKISHSNNRSIANCNFFFVAFGHWPLNGYAITTMSTYNYALK